MSPDRSSWPTGSADITQDNRPGLILPPASHEERNRHMSEWKRPSDFEEWAVDKAEELGIDEEAFLSGALWAALVAEGRIDVGDDDE